MSKKQDTQDEVVKPLGLQDIADLSPPSAPSSPSPVANLSMKLPVFWPDAAKVWFSQAEIQFAICNVTVSKTKFYHYVAEFLLLQLTSSPITSETLFKLT